jgi:electron-transferring-flavoprotein dehydrogenase
VQRGQISGFGAKVINEGGYHAMPALVGEGVAIVGEAGGLVNAMNLKGIDLAIRSGMEAGKVIALGKPLSEYPRALGQTPEFKAFQRARNVHQYFTYSMPEGMVATGLAMFTRGLLPPRIAPRKAGLVPHSPGSQGPRKAALCSSLVHLTRVSNRGPEHISVDEGMCLKCLRDYGQPCARFCPAGVYEAVPETGRVLVHAEDCIHCRTCAVKDPYGSINWNAPVDGPRYVMM